MKSAFISIFIAFLLSTITNVVCAQEKTQAYYVQNEIELLPDAQAAFSKGNYERAALLCRWHYIIVGSHATDSLREKSEQCQLLIEDINYLSAEGNNELALEKALTLLTINPEDVMAKDLLLAAEVANNEEIVEEDNDLPQKQIEPEEPPVHQNESLLNSELEQVEPATIGIGAIPQSETDTLDLDDNVKRTDRRTIYGLKAGVSIPGAKHFFESEPNNMSQYLAYFGSLCVYNIAKSRFGIEVGALFSPSATEIAPFNEVNAAVAFRIGDDLYLKGLGGYFFSKNKIGNTRLFNGKCFGAGLNTFMNEHFCIEFGVRYYSVNQTHQMDNTNDNNKQSDLKTAPDGISPFLCIGLLF